MTTRRAREEIAMQDEQWRPAPGFPDYMVSDMGRVVSHKRKRPYELHQRANHKGYPCVAPWLAGATHATWRPVHTLVTAAFIGPRPAGMVVRHLDGDKNNNAAANLVYGTASENMLDQVAHGTHRNARKTHCANGHAYAQANVRVGADGKRACRTCKRAVTARWRERKAAASTS